LRSACIVVIAASLPAGARLHAAQDGCAGTVAGRLPSKAATPTDGGTPMRRTRYLFPLLALLLFAAACGERTGDAGNGGSGGATGATGATGADAIDHPTGADDLVLRIDTSGGFVPVEWSLRNVPGVSIYGDGRMIVTGPVIEIYPGPALPNLQVTRLTEEALQAILAAAEDAGLLDGDASYDYPCVADVPTTTFTVSANGTTSTTSAYALGFDAATGATGACGGMQVDTEARAQLNDFAMKVGDVRSWLPAGSYSAEEPYLPTEMRVYVGDARRDPELQQVPIEWPLETPLAQFGEADRNLADLRCGVVAGADLAAVLPLAQQANELTPWTSDGERYGLTFRPLLPDEHGC
jgi:hypothetical protein